MNILNVLIGKRKIFNALLALVLVVSFGTITAAPAAAATTINVPGDYATIQAAITAASPGDTINVASGTYNESVTIDKDNLTLTGDAGSKPHITGGLKFDTDLSGLTLENFYVTGSIVGQTSIVRMYGAVTDLSVDNCVFDGENVPGRYGFTGGQLEGDVSITNSEFKDIPGWAVFDTRSGSGGDGSAMGTVTFAYNHVHDCDGSIVFRGLEADWTDNVYIHDNIFENIGEAGVSDHWAAFEVNRALNVGIYDNQISNVVECSWGEGQAMQLWHIGTADIQGNTVTNNYMGIAFLNWPVPWDVSGVTVHNNSFSGNDQFALDVAVGLLGGPLNATNNWWGDTDPSDAVSGLVDYSPWYGATIGTAPMTWYTNDSIRDAIDLAVSGETVIVVAGTYDEMVVIDKDNLTLLGANAGIHPVVGTHPTETVGARGAETILSHNGMYAINPQADGITVDGFKFTGGNGRLIDTYEDAENFHLTNCIFDSPTQAVSKGVIQFGGGSHTDMLIDFNLFQDQGDHTLYFGGGPYDGLTISANKFNSYGNGVFWGTDTPLVDGVIEYNEFDGTIGGVPGEGGVGLNIGKGGNIAIRNNWFHDMYYTGFQVGIIGGSVTGNTFEDTYPILSGGTWYPSDAFQLWGGEWGTQVSSDVTIIGNTIIFNQQSIPEADENGIRLRTGCDAASIHISSNDFVNGGVSPTAFAVRNQGTGTLDAENNWWGIDSEPDIQSMLSGDVDYDPWIGDPDDNDFEYIGDGETGTVNVGGSSVGVTMNPGQSGSFSATAKTGAPTQGFSGMGGGSGLNKSLVVTTDAANGTYIAVIKLNYTDAELLAAGIDEDDLRLYYWDGATWKLAVEGNVGPTNDVRWMGDSAPAAAIAANLGMHGVDKTNNIAWAVVDHNTDYSAGIGPLVAWVDLTYTPATPGWHIDRFDSIQDAIDSCAAGATIHVLAGTYTDNLIVNKPNMTISSADTANTIIQPGAGVGIDIQSGGTGLTLDGLTILSGGGTTFLIQLTNAPADVTISNNIINTVGSASQGISVGATGATSLSVTDNEFTAESGDGSIWGPKVADVTVSGNTFTGPGGLVSGYAVEFAGVTGTSSINDNTITGYGMGIAIFNGEGTTGLSILDNDISGCNNGIRLGQYSASAINGDMTVVTVTGNTLSANAIGIRINDGVNVLANQFLIEYNYISGSTNYGLQNEHSSLVVTAMKNWWGDNKGPNHPSNPLGCPPYGIGDAITDHVIYQPWLDNGSQPSTGDYIDAIADASTEVFIRNAGAGYVVSAGRWSHNPDGVYPDFMVVGGYFIDVIVEDYTGFGADTEMEIRFHYTNDDINAGLIEQTLRMKWWDGANWQNCSDTGVNTQDNYVWVIVTTDTSPNLAQMNGTPFAASGQRVVIPSLSSWGALVLAVLFLSAIVWVMRRKKLIIPAG